MMLTQKNTADQRRLGSLLRAVFATCAVFVIADVSSASAAEAARPRLVEYSVINLGSPFMQAFLNEHGEAAVQFFNGDQSTSMGFFDGQRVIPIPSLGGEPTIMWGMNNNGVVVGQSADPSQPTPVTRAFAWRRDRGTRALSGPIGSGANAINDRNEVVGWVYGDIGIDRRAVRWNADGTMSTLGPLPSSSSEANDVNAAGVSTGAFDGRATVWDANGRAVDLGSTDGGYTMGQFINASGSVAGVGSSTGFFWSRKLGMIKFIDIANTSQNVQGMNNKGEVAGQTNTAGPHGDVRFGPFIWSAGQGLRNLPLAGFPTAVVYGLNNKTEMVGFANRADFGGSLAVYWRGVSDPVDLNSRLYRAPAGLVLYSAQAINEKGDIIAESNAGTVFLRPGRQGTAAPVLGPISSPMFDQEGGGVLNGTADITVSFIDSSARESHVASATVSDGCPQDAPGVREVRGTGEVNFRHSFCQPGFFDIRVQLTDSAGNSTEIHSMIYVYDKSVATLSGQGTLPGATAEASPSGRRPLRFALWAPLADSSAKMQGRQAAPFGLVRLVGPFSFDGRVAVLPVRSEQSVRLEGTGRLNGRQGYRFTVETTPGNDRLGIAARLHVTISHTEPATKAEIVDYDNGAVAAPRTAAVAAAVHPATGTQVMVGKVHIVEKAGAHQ